MPIITLQNISKPVIETAAEEDERACVVAGIGFFTDSYDVSMRVSP